jgi:hypothetical protein
MKQATSALQDLLDATEPAISGEGRSEAKGRNEEAQKLLTDRAIVRALQKMSGEINETLRQSKKKLSKK